MSTLSDAALERLRSLGDLPDLTSTRYEFIDEVGRGGMGTVYRVRDRELGRELALKVVAESILGPDATQRLVREAKALARLEHPGIVPVHDAGTLPDGRAFYAMRLVRGERLDQRLRRELSLGEGLRLLSRIGDAIAFAHANGVIHRDLKPPNVMLGAFGEVLVLDWGLAKVRSESTGLPGQRSPDAPRDGAIDGRSTTSPVALSPGSGGSAPATLDGTVIGTPGFMAPEQAAGDIARIDERTDVFALGMILSALVEATQVKPRRPLAAIVARATAHEPSARYQTAAGLCADVSRLQDGLPVSAYRESLLERAVRVARRHQWAIGLVLAYLAMRLALFAWRGR